MSSETKFRNSYRPGGRLLPVLACLAALAAPSVFAADCFNTGGEIAWISLPATVEVSPDLAQGALLTPWFASEADFDCSAQPLFQNATFTAYYRGTGTYLSSSGYEGGSMQVYKTNISGVGVAVAARMKIFNEQGNWGSSPRPDIKLVATLTGQRRLQEHSPMARAEVRVALVRTQDAIGTGGRLTLVDVAEVRESVNAYVRRLVRNNSQTNVVVRERSCRVPDNIGPVQLASVTPSTLGGINSAGPGKDFSITVTECLNVVNAVSYRLDPTTSALNAAQGVFALDPSSTATGVGIQITDADGKPVPLGSAIRSDYVKGSGGISIPLRAAIYQVNPSVGAGTVNSSLTFTMTYQ